MNSNLLVFSFAFACLVIFSCRQKTTKIVDEFPVRPGADSMVKETDLLESDTALIKNKHYVLSVYKNDSVCFFAVKQETGNGQYKTIMADPDYGTNNSDIGFKDENNDGYKDIVWHKKWQAHSYLFNPTTEAFVEVGEFHTIDTLKIHGSPVLYKNKYPLIYYSNGEKPIQMSKCGEDTMFVENHSELFVIDENYQKISFATLDNFETVESRSDTITCGAQMVFCYVPPYYGKFGDNSIWNSGEVFDSAYLPPSAKFYHGDEYSIDDDYIANYWLANYKKLLQYGQVFKVRRDKPLEYYK